MILLHLSDIHFGRDNPQYGIKGSFNQKKEILEALIYSIKNNEMKPDHIVVTGDIAWFGKKADFNEALIWFKDLLRATNLSGSDITFCPGNHDVNRSFGNYKTDLSYEDINTIDQVYKYDCVHRMESPLYNYDKFCEALGVVPYHYPKTDNWEVSYAIGYKDVSSSNGEKFRIVSFNTALLSFIKEYPDDQMSIGQPQVMDLLKYNLIGTERKYYTIALFHHAERFLHTHEICEYDNRFATLPLLRRYVDLVLCGHTETGGVPVIYKQTGGAEMLTGGAAYYSDDHANAYSIVIVPDNLQKGTERTICLLPFTYSIEKGWHQNKKTELPVEFSTINEERPDFKCRSDFKLKLTYDDQNMSIPLKCVSVFTKKDNTAILSNSEDVCRNLDITCSGPTDKLGASHVNIKIASTKENSVEALLECETVFRFLNHATKTQNKSSFKILDNAGNIFLSGKNISSNVKTEDEVIEFLNKIRKIEQEYDLIFQCPKDNADQIKVDVLNDLIELGYTTAFKAIPELETNIADKKKLLKIGLLSLKNRSLYILHKGIFQCKLYGNVFSLGDATVFMGPYSIKRNNAIFKALTFVDGDNRRIKLSLCDDSVCYLITDQVKFDITKKFVRTPQYICVEEMSCTWDFISEVRSRTASD